MRLVMPAEFMRLPAQMKNGTARSGNESTPPYIRWMTTKSGIVPEYMTKASEATAIAMATGNPLTISARKPASRLEPISGRRAEVGPLENAVAFPPVAPRPLQRTKDHEEEAKLHRAEPPAHGELDNRHGL